MTVPFDIHVVSADQSSRSIKFEVRACRPSEVFLVASKPTGDVTQTWLDFVERVWSSAEEHLSGSGTILRLFVLGTPRELDRSQATTREDRLKAIESAASVGVGMGSLIEVLEQRRETALPGWLAVVLVGQPPIDAHDWLPKYAETPGVLFSHVTDQPRRLESIESIRVQLGAPIDWEVLAGVKLGIRIYERLQVSVRYWSSLSKWESLPAEPDEKEERVVWEHHLVSVQDVYTSTELPVDEAGHRSSALLLRAYRRDLRTTGLRRVHQKSTDLRGYHWDGYWSARSATEERLIRTGKQRSSPGMQLQLRRKLECWGAFLELENSGPRWGKTTGSGFCISVAPLLWGAAHDMVSSGAYDFEENWIDGGYGQCSPESFLRRTSGEQFRELRPLINITWFEASALVRSLGGRLPSRAELRQAIQAPDQPGSVFQGMEVAFGHAFMESIGANEEVFMGTHLWWPFSRPAVWCSDILPSAEPKENAWRAVGGHVEGWREGQQPAFPLEETFALPPDVYSEQVGVRVAFDRV